MCGYDYVKCKVDPAFWVQSTVIPQNICVCARHLARAVSNMSAMSHDAIRTPRDDEKIGAMVEARGKYHQATNRALVTVKAIIPDPHYPGQHFYR